MAEILLNCTWAAVAITAFVVLLPKAVSRRHAIAALICCAALLFPIISLSDDLSADRDGKVAAAVLVAIELIIGLMAIASITVRHEARVSFVLAKHADPRSPPAR